MKQGVFYIALALVICAFAAAFLMFVGAGQWMPRPEQAITASRTVVLKGQTIRVTVAESPREREIGLGGRSGLASDEGMLFVFPKDGIYAFWMKDTHFSIDILWLSAEGIIVHMAQNVSPETYPQTFRSETPARFVLELPAGYAKEYTVRVGDIVTF